MNKMNVNRKSAKILLIDDDPVFRRVMSLMFVEEGYSIFTAENIESGLRMIEEQDYKVAVVDYKLPDRTGVDFFEQTRLTHPNMVRILLTAYTTESVLLEAINRGEVFRYIRKPVHTSLLISSIEQALVLHEIVESRAEFMEQLERQSRELKQKSIDLSAAYQQIGELNLLQDQILDILPSPFFLVTDDHRIQGCNQAACRLVGYFPGELLGKVVDELIHESGRLDASMQLPRASKAAWKYEMVFSHKNNSQIRCMVEINILQSADSGDNIKIALLVSEL